jgi:hypothetical protein
MIGRELLTAYNTELERGYSSLARGEIASALSISCGHASWDSAILGYMSALIWQC